MTITGESFTIDGGLTADRPARLAPPAFRVCVTLARARV